MRRHAIAAAVATGLAILDASGALAKPPRRETSSVAEIVFTEVERRLIREYYARSAPDAAHAGLPPGIRKKVARGKPLPPGIAKRNLPPDLDGRLPSRVGTARLVIGNDVVLVAVATNIVLDILFDALRR